MMSMVKKQQGDTKPGPITFKFPSVRPKIWIENSRQPVVRWESAMMVVMPPKISQVRDGELRACVYLVSVSSEYAVHMQYIHSTYI